MISSRPAVVTDLPNELMSALQQGLSQFGINLPPLPTGLSPAGAQPVQAGPTLTTPGLTAPGLTTPGLTTPGLTTPGPDRAGSDHAGPDHSRSDHAGPDRTRPDHTQCHRPRSDHAEPDHPGTDHDPVADRLRPLTNPALTTPQLGTTPSLTSPPATGLGLPNEQPITAPLGPTAGTYPILGDPSLGRALRAGQFRRDHQRSEQCGQPTRCRPGDRPAQRHGRAVDHPGDPGRLDGGGRGPRGCPGRVAQSLRRNGTAGWGRPFGQTPGEAPAVPLQAQLSLYSHWPVSKHLQQWAHT